MPTAHRPLASQAAQFLPPNLLSLHSYKPYFTAIARAFLRVADLPHPIFSTEGGKQILIGDQTHGLCEKAMSSDLYWAFARLGSLVTTTSIILTTVDDLAVLLKKDVTTIYSDVYRAPHRLPPRAKIPGSRRLLFVNVNEWILSHVVEPSTPDISSVAQKKRRGRPTKAEHIANRKRGG